MNVEVECIHRTERDGSYDKSAHSGQSERPAARRCNRAPLPHRAYPTGGLSLSMRTNLRRIDGFPRPEAPGPAWSFPATLADRGVAPDRIGDFILARHMFANRRQATLLRLP